MRQRQDARHARRCGNHGQRRQHPAGCEGPRRPLHPDVLQSLNITNPLFPKGPRKISQTIQLGNEPDTKLRFEATQLDQTRTVRWKGKDIKTRVTHYVAYHKGRIAEVAYDFYAQDDKGAVWYFGEDVTNHEDGVIKDHDGTWLAGRDGPPGMIMPTKPNVGDVFRPENIAPLVFEEATVKAINVTVPGPRGPVKGAVDVELKLLDGAVENKIFAPPLRRVPCRGQDRRGAVPPGACRQLSALIRDATRRRKLGQCRSNR